MRIARIHDLHTAKHLTNNHFDVLVVDLHTLQTIHVLNFVHDVAGQSFDTEQTQDVVRIGRTFNDFFTALNHLAVVHENLLVLGDQAFVLVAVQIGNDQTLLALGFLTERNGTGFLGEHAGILRTAGFKELGHTRQTTGNVAGLLAFARDTGKNFAFVNLLTVAHHDNGVDRQLDRHGVIRTRDLDVVAVFVDEVHHRTHHVGGSRLRALALGTGGGALRVDDDH